jgi:cobalt-precorrin-5B (C1)-methyltransferase
VESKNKKLRSGYTTGACAAAAAKAAVMQLRNAECTLHSREALVSAGINGMRNEEQIERVEIPFPDGSRVAFKIHDAGCRIQDNTAYASVIKDAGDDPDITNGAEIRAEVSLNLEFGKGNAERVTPEIVIRGGKGVGTVTKPGLALPVGEAAINPVPRRMITEAVMEAVSAADSQIPNQSGPLDRPSAFRIPHLEVTISVPAGEELAKKTLNHRLGIIGGISILGTTGIVRPISAEAWTATITASMDVAKAAGLGAVVISSGRTSEKAHMKKYHLPDEAYAMMGDYLEFSLRDAKRHGFREAHLCAQWAKMLKAAMGTPQTHVRNGALEAAEAADFLIKLGIELPGEKVFNTSREIYDFINSEFRIPNSAFEKVCAAANRYARGITSGIPVIVHLVSYEGDIIAESE